MPADSLLIDEGERWKAVAPTDQVITNMVKQRGDTERHEFEILDPVDLPLTDIDRYDVVEVDTNPDSGVVNGSVVAVSLVTVSVRITLFVFTLPLFALPNDPVLAHIGLFSLAPTLLITDAGPYALDNVLGATIDSDLYSSSEVVG